MAKAGADHNYKFGQKNHWRRTIWNEVLRRTGGRELNHPILYLAGKDDLDRKVAVEKGVPDQNLIAIDRSKQNATSIRACGVPSLHGDALDILWSWPKGRLVSAVLLDFCSGLEYSNLGIFDAFQRPAFRDAVIVVNFMRGRDPWSNGLRQLLTLAGLDQPLWLADTKNDNIKCICDEPKHRAFQFLMYHAVDTVSTTLQGSHRFSGDGRLAEKPMAYLTPEDGDSYTNWKAMIGLVIGQMRPVFYSYKSGSLTFDSCVCCHNLNGLSADPSLPKFIADLLDSDPDIRTMESIWSIPAMMRRISATLAVRTRRMARSV